MPHDLIPYTATTPIIPRRRRFDLLSGHDYFIDGKVVLYDRKRGEQEIFIDSETKDYLFYTADQIVDLVASGRLSNHPLRHSDYPREMSSDSLITYSELQIAAIVRRQRYIDHAYDASGALHLGHKILARVIREVASEIGDPHPPSTSTLYRWCRRRLESAHATIHRDLVDRRAFRVSGAMTGRFHEIIEAEVKQAMLHWLAPKVTSKLAYASLYTRIAAVRAEYERLHPAIDFSSLKPPSLRTFQRRLAQIDRYTADYYRIGKAYADKKYRIYDTCKLPERPYQYVEIDHGTMDDELLDDDRRLNLGRPTLTLLRDRATGMIVGYHVSFEKPSVAAVIMAIRNAVYPKNLSRFPAVTLDWPCWGRIENLVVDNGLDFLAGSIHHGCSMLGTNVVRTHAYSPHEKGGIERSFRSLNTGLIHLLPGTTLSSFVERKDMEELSREERKQKFQKNRPTLTLYEFECLVVYWIVMIYNQSVSKGLGFIRGLGGIPQNIWNEKISRFPAGEIPEPDAFIAIAGERTQRDITDRGIQWDYLIYTSPLLTQLRANDHRSPKEPGGRSYTVTRDPCDLGSVYVTDPYHPGTVIRVDACSDHADYARGLHRHVHSVRVRHARDKLEIAEDLTIDHLMKARAELLSAIEKVRNSRPTRRTHRLLSRYISGEYERRHVSVMTAPAPAIGAGRVPPAAPTDQRLPSSMLIKTDTSPTQRRARTKPPTRSVEESAAHVSDVVPTVTDDERRRRLEERLAHARRSNFGGQ